MQYNTSLSSKVLSIVVFLMLKISGKSKGPPELIINSKLIIVDNEEDQLCWYRFIALCVYPELLNTKKYYIMDHSQKLKAILLADHGITYSNHMTQADKKRPAVHRSTSMTLCP